MDISFRSGKFRELCNSDRLLIKEFGQHRAKKIRQRLDDLRAAENLGEMRNLPGRCHELKGDRKGQLSLDLDHPHRLIFEVADDPIPVKPDGGLDWSQVTAIRLLGIEDTHG